MVKTVRRGVTEGEKAVLTKAQQKRLAAKRVKIVDGTGKPIGQYKATHVERAVRAAKKGKNIEREGMTMSAVLDEKQPSAPTGARPPAHRPGGLATLESCRKEMARLYRDSRAGRLDPNTGYKLSAILAAVARLVQASDLEKHLTKLEEEAQPLPWVD